MATKKNSTKKKALKKVSSDEGFYFSDGSMCRDLLELSEKLHKMSDDLFSQHVNADKNDFANWIEGVFDEPTFAKKLRVTKSKDGHCIEILRFVVQTLK